LWTAAGGSLGEVTFINETASGWQQAFFGSPIDIQPNTTYVVSYFAPNGGYAYDANYFTTNGVDNGVLHAPNNAAASGNGVYLYAPTGGFPNNTFGSANYWVDVIFENVSTPDTTGPNITLRQPAGGAVNVAINGAVNVTFNEALDAATVNGSTLELRTAGIEHEQRALAAVGRIAREHDLGATIARQVGDRDTAGQHACIGGVGVLPQRVARGVDRVDAAIETGEHELRSGARRAVAWSHLRPDGSG
jgi:hypothetical protein